MKPGRSCLVVMPDVAVSEHAEGGASPLIRGHIRQLQAAGVTTTLAVLAAPQAAPFNQPRQDRLAGQAAIAADCQAAHRIELTPSRNGRARLSSVRLYWSSPGEYLYGPWIHGGVPRALRRLVAAVEPHLIWAEHLIPFTIVASLRAGALSIYSHHDWHWKIKRRRNPGPWPGLRQALSWAASRRHERNLVRGASACVTASRTEAEEISRYGAKHVGYFPPTYTAIHDTALPALPGPVRVVHLGGMQTTASRLGLQRFLDVVWPQLRQQIGVQFELWVIGSLNGAPPSLTSAFEQAGAQCTGFVPDLNAVLRPFDIHVIPWEHNTGTRTRIPLALNYSQAVVSTAAAAACLPELDHEHNCLLVHSLRDMGSAIARLVQHPEIRIRLARAGRQTFLQHFTLEAQQPRFDAFLDLILRTSHRSA